jgi:REP element-mobilizing transposase RayT
MERYRIVPEAAVYFVTYSVVDWLPVFVSEATCRIITSSLTFCHERKNLGVNAYVIMPTHMHAINFDRQWDNERLQNTLTDFRKFTGRALCDFFESHPPKCFAETFRAASTKDRERRFWQPSRHPEAIESEKFWRQKLDYIHENPCRKGLVRRAADWRYSSAAYYVLDGSAACDVSISSINWS